ncbi:hypothetical protein WH47_00574 [Habropoda laboriosa]|uniref:Uncharacterized protein n=1 Tax=Habropoda laboriosa TaxID=597456 RepID=A0A0L7QKD3_9HYME|nr:hypothetical protein WH47_00574 [Habropoda laboriosa]
MTATVEDYYDGSRSFSWLANFIDLPIDQVSDYFLSIFLPKHSLLLICLSTAQKEGASIEL